ncbi:phosphoribosylformylglycinamidine cyclo-ligase [Devriesea agamarum]|uniref:phosphoribosylformylglycinamidine cyclo-ligase n=1 Tax=Devriesea agamarum TaxID=472569 RepID=UPI00071E1BFC|nr:phosphoribosylformylglycinamidine cyclo-ligase [Devriesea agamarum]
MTEARPVTYASAGVDTHAGDTAVALMKEAVAATHGPSVLGGIGGFAGLVDVSSFKNYRRPLLASSTDGVGTKVAVAQALDIHHTIGQDLVAMVVDDIVVCGARPVAMTDYIACGRVVPDRIADIVRGIADGCRLADCALVGGETAEHPGLLGPDDYDVAGAAVGVVEADALLGPDRVQPGDVVLGLESSGLHSNGYSLVRAALARAGVGYEEHDDLLGRTVGAELLEPTKIYAADLLFLIDEMDTEVVRAFSHITGGGLAANLARVLPRGLTAHIDRGSWVPGPIFDHVRDWGAVPQLDLEATLNMGIGMVAVLAPDSVAQAVDLLAQRGLATHRLGSIVQEPHPGTAQGAQGLDIVVSGAKGVDGGAVALTGQYPGWPL